MGSSAASPAIPAIGIVTSDKISAAQATEAKDLTARGPRWSRGMAVSRWEIVAQTFFRCSEAAPANTSSVDEETGQTHSGGFMPFMTGYLLGSNTVDGNCSYSSPYYSNRSGDYFTGNGSSVSRNAFLTSSGSRSNIQMYSNDFTRPAPAKFQSRTAVISRGGFGGGARSYGG